MGEEGMKEIKIKTKKWERGDQNWWYKKYRDNEGLFA